MSALGNWESGGISRSSTIGANNKLKMILVSVNLKLVEKIKRHENSTLYVVCKRGSEEWRSKPSENAGFQPIWSMQQCAMSYKELKNLIYIEVKDRDQPIAKALGECNASVEHLINQPEGKIVLPLFNNGDNIGSITFETFDESHHEDCEVDSNYPHVKPLCKVCNDTHKNEKGTPYQCRYCVCVKCNGTGITASTKKECSAMKLMT